MEQASASIIPLMLSCMTKQSEDDDEYNISKAAGLCIETTAGVITNAIVDLVLPFITQNINNVNWRLKDAAVAVFGLVLDGPDDSKIRPIISQALPVLILCMKDENRIVRDTSTWTIGRICELHKESITKEAFVALAAGLAGALEDPSAIVAQTACTAVFQLAASYIDENDEDSNDLSMVLPHFLQKLLVVSTREDAEDENICKDAYEAINQLVESSAKDMQTVIIQLLTEVVNRLEVTFSPQFTSNIKSNMQSCFCILIGEIVKKLPSESLMNFSDKIMQLLLQFLSANKNATAREDAIVTIGPFAEKLEANFIRYMPHLQPIILANLKQSDEHVMCTVTVGLFGDLCRALKADVLPFCDDVMRSLLELLHSQTINRFFFFLVFFLYTYCKFLKLLCVCVCKCFFFFFFHKCII
jgi:importin subunit beta-1